MSSPRRLVVRGGTLVDGSGGAPRRADVAITGDRITTVGDVSDAAGADEIDARGRVVTPGFVNVLSHAWDSLQVAPYANSDLVQGVTTEVFGEGISLGPTSPALERLLDREGRVAGARTDFPRLGDGLDHVVRTGVAVNVASFVGGHNLRALVAELDDRPLAARELDRLRTVLADELSDGALGLGTALIYPPGCYATTDELVALAEVVAEHDGLYVSHLRSEADRLLDGVDELLEIGRRSGARCEIYHLKASGRPSWPAMATAVERIERARDHGQPVTASMYPYTAGATSLVSCVPPSYHASGALLRHLGDLGARARITAEIAGDRGGWENLYVAAGGGTGILLLQDLHDGTPIDGRRLDRLARDLGRSELDLLLDVCARQPGMLAAFFTVDEENLRIGLRQPWVSICSDSPAFVDEAPWNQLPAHPRGYGAFARVLGRYVRQEGVLGLADAVRRMTSLPAQTLRLAGRGLLTPGAFADVVVLDPETIADTATFESPHSYAVGVEHVLVNGVPAVRHGALTGERPGRRLRRGA
jgi:N-acyl-D-amino-acid deacylase